MGWRPCSWTWPMSAATSKTAVILLRWGGTWMMLTYGFGGMRDCDGKLSFWPRRAPEDSAILRFPITYHGQRLEVEIGQHEVEYNLRKGECLTIRHESE